MINTPDNSLNQILAQLERSVEVPIVPGEVQSWLLNASGAMDRLVETFHDHVTCLHTQQFETIRSEDSGLLSRVQAMVREDEAIDKQLKELATRSKKLLASIESFQRDEAAMADSLSRFTDDTIATVVRIRKQEASIETWFSESLQRDRGIAD